MGRTDFFSLKFKLDVNGSIRHLLAFWIYYYFFFFFTDSLVLVLRWSTLPGSLASAQIKHIVGGVMLKLGRGRRDLGSQCAPPPPLL